MPIKHDSSFVETDMCACVCLYDGGLYIAC
jgi:hypothetical protein